MAVTAGVESAVQIHIDRGDDLNARDASGMTPLMLSAARNKPSICKLLLNAGADHGLLDPAGRTALDIAVAAGSDSTVAVLAALRNPSTPATHHEKEIQPGPEQAFEAGSSCASAQVLPDANESDAQVERPLAELASPTATTVGVSDDGEFDLSGWEAEQEPTRPEADSVLLDSASAIQIAITAHEPVDSSAEWDDIDAYLPESALPLARMDDAEGRARLRLLLLRALREGSVPALDVQAQSLNDDRSGNPEAEAYLAMVINDLGAEVDERFEYANVDESFQVFVDPDETPSEEVALDEALAAVDRAASPRNEPLRIYQREFQQLRLLDADEEVRLAKNMEAALDSALDALARWPDGIARTLAAGADAIAGSRQLSSIWIGGETDPESVSTEGWKAGEPASGHSEDATDEEDGSGSSGAADTGDTAFADALRRLAGLIVTGECPGDSSHEIREALAGLHLNRRYLLELIDPAHGSAPCPMFARAMAEFRRHRDQMTSANLKLAFFHAKKYLYSGERLDDLAQEGNIGLLKAVDRYDWRRGFRFSTYATWWIRQQISRYIADKARTIRIPVHAFEKVQRAARMSRAFEATFGREPTLAELSERMEMPSHNLASLLRVALEPMGIDDASIDGMISNDAHATHVSPDPADVVNDIQLNRAVDRLISALASKNRKEEMILRLRFGIGVNEALTLEELGMRFEVTRERIRQIEAKAIRKLQHPSRSEPFARMVLGLEPEENPLAARVHGPSEDGHHTAERVPQPVAPKLQAVLDPPRDRGRASSTSKPSALDQLLAKAAELGIRVDDDRVGSGRIWVELVEARENTHRRLVRQLLAFGFAFWPGKGYWK